MYLKCARLNLSILKKITVNIFIFCQNTGSPHTPFQTKTREVLFESLEKSWNEETFASGDKEKKE